MEQITYLTKTFLLTSMSGRGAFFSLMVLLLFLAMPKKIKSATTTLLGYRHDYVATALLAITFVTGLVYLSFPNYLDHVESTIASLGMVLERGEVIYPFPDFYPYHGLLYGPLLATVQTAFTQTGLSVLVASKLPGLIAFLISITACLYVIKNPMARGYLIYLIPFGLMLFWNRAEPFFLLLVCMTLFFTDNKIGNKNLPIIAGILAGTASALKLHGASYIFSAYLAATLGATLSIPSLLVFSISALISFLAFFLPSNISLVNFFEYLKLASAHGLSLRMWLENLVYLLFLAIPLLISWSVSNKNRDMGMKISAVILIEFFVTIIGAKPGAGTHHLLPFIPINAYIINRLHLDAKAPRSSIIKVMYFALIVPALSTILTVYVPMIKTWMDFRKAGDEVQLLDKKYPDLVMGLTDDKNYSYAYLRVLLSGEQIDYPSFMDLQFSGVSDLTMSENMRMCTIKNILLPNDGAPFSMNNYYTGKPLLSPGVQQSFSGLYEISFHGNYFSVYTCNNVSK
jgi:hypothetical protein